MKSRYQTARKWLIFWTLFIGIGAVAGAACMLIEPSGSIMGMDAMLPYFQVLPFASVLFQNFTFSGIALLIVNGLAAPMRAFCMAAKGKFIRRIISWCTIIAAIIVPRQMRWIACWE